MAQIQATIHQAHLTKHHQSVLAQAESLNPQHHLSVRGTGLPQSLASIAVDPSSGDIYVADVAAGLHRITHNRDSFLLSQDFTAGMEGGFSPLGTDIEFFDGGVYVCLSAGELLRIDAETGDIETVGQFSQFGAESGLMRLGSRLYASPGLGDGVLSSFDLVDKTQETIQLQGRGNRWTTLEYDPVSGLAMALDARGFFHLTVPCEGSFSGPIEHGPSDPDAYNFAIEPGAEALYRVHESILSRIELTENHSEPLVQGFQPNGLVVDLAFGPSSIPSGNQSWSLYMTSGFEILELDGFADSLQSGHAAPSSIALPSPTIAHSPSSESITLSLPSSGQEPILFQVSDDLIEWSSLGSGVMDQENENASISTPIPQSPGARYFRGRTEFNDNSPDEVENRKMTISFDYIGGVPEQDAFEMIEAAIEGHQLLIDIRHGGGCKEHAYNLYWSGVVLLSFPPVVELHLRHDAMGDQCEAVISERLAFNILPILRGDVP